MSGVLARVSHDMTNTNHRAKCLQNTAIPRKFFDPRSDYDRAVYNIFRKTGRWVKHYYVEEPHNNVPSTIESKLMEAFLADVDGLTQEIASEYRINLTV